MKRCAMRTIIDDRVRNYYWGFFRRTSVSARVETSTHTLMKNPWHRHLGVSSGPPVEIGQWHRLLFVQEGARLRCGLDGREVLTGLDDPLNGSGPVFSIGRIGLRLMFQTRMRFRSLRVYTRDPAD